MLLIHSPYCQLDLPELEFTYAGEAHNVRPEKPSEYPDVQWEKFLFVRSNPRGGAF